MSADELVADAHLPGCTQLEKLAEIAAVGCMNAICGELHEVIDGGIEWGWIAVPHCCHSSGKC
jgi:hypothetical protein